MSLCRLIISTTLIFNIFTTSCCRSAIKDNTFVNDDGFYVLNPKDFASHLGTDYEWAMDNVPFIDFPQNNDILTTYYYRWRMYRKHIVYTEEDNVGYVVTEFLPKVPWSGFQGTIDAAAGHHIMEGRWIHDEAIINDYVNFWAYSNDALPALYTNWIAYAAWQRYLLNGNTTFITSLQPGLANLFRNKYIPKYLVNRTQQQIQGRSNVGGKTMDMMRWKFLFRGMVVDRPLQVLCTVKHGHRLNLQTLLAMKQ